MNKIFSLIMLVSVYGCGLGDGHIYFSSEYANDVHAYAEQNGLGDEWVSWMLENEASVGENYYAVKKLKSKEIVGSISYLKDTAKLYTVPWASKEELAVKLQKMLNLAFVGWSFNLAFDSSSATTDFTISLGADGHSRAKPPDEVLLNSNKGEGYIVHEVAHLFYTMHHYDTNDRIGKGDHTPPGEKAGCIMDFSHPNFCSAHRFALGIPSNVDYAKEIYDLELEMSSHYE